MTRLLKWVGLAVLVLALGVGGVLVVSFHGLSPIENGLQLDGVQVIKDGIVACYVVDLGGGKVALVDACNDSSARGVLSALRRRDLGPDAVSAILLTHGDKDHIGGTVAFPGAQVMALAPDVALAEGRETRFLKGLVSPKDTGVRVGRSLADGELVDLGPVMFQVFAVPGHTRGSAAYLARGVLFMGDSAGVTTDGTLAPALRLTSDDPGRNRDALVALARRLEPMAADIHVIAPAHSGVLSQGLTPLIDLARGKP